MSNDNDGVEMAVKGTAAPKKVWSCHVHIIEVRDLKGRDRGGTSDPVCFVTCFEDKQHTATLKKCNGGMYDHLFFFEHPEDLTEEKVRPLKVSIQVFDANTFTRNTLIGAFDFDAGVVYDQPNHEYYRKWVLLTDTEHNANEVQGYLKCSVLVLSNDDSPPTHTPDEEDDDDEGDTTNLQDLVLKPPGLTSETYELKVRLFKAENLPKMDALTGKIDGYVELKFGGNPPQQTQVIKNNYNPTWNQEITLPVQVPTMTDSIEMAVFDWDRAGANDLVARNYFSFSSVMEQSIQPRWLNMYRAREGGFREKMKLKKHEEVEPTEFCGRVLYSMEVAKNSNASLGVAGTSPMGEPRKESYVLRFDLYEGNEFQANKLQKIRLELCCGNHTVGKSKENKPKEGGIVEWYEQFKELKCDFPEDASQIPDIILNCFVVAAKTASRVGYIRFTAEELLKKGTKDMNVATWHALTADKTSAAYEPNEVPGFLLFAISLNSQRDVMSIKRPPSLTKPEQMMYELRANVYQARNLPAADSNGLSDPHVVVKMGTKKKRTITRMETLNPLYYETLAIRSELAKNLSYAPNIVVQVYDFDASSSDDIIGRVEFKPTELKADKLPPRPRWYPLYLDDPNETEGEILLSFQLFPAEDTQKYPLVDITPDFRDSVFEISLVGCRNLLPVAMRKVQNPYVVFDCGDEKKKIKSVNCKTPSAQNPNHLQVLRLELPLPEDPIFAPMVNVRVFDDRLKDVLQGSASIPTEAFLPWKLGDFELPGEKIEPVSDIPGTDGNDVGFDTKKSYDDIAEANDDDDDNKPSNANDNDNDEEKQKTEGEEQKEPEPERTIPDVDETSFGEAKEEKKDEDDDPLQKRPHTNDALELELGQLPFYEYELTRGTSRTMSAMDRLRAKMKKKKGKVAKVTTVGKLKANFRAFERSQRDDFEPPDLKAQFSPKPFVVRVYVLRGRYLVGGPKCVPYLALQPGPDSKKAIKDKTGQKMKTLAPDFFHMFQTELQLPGPDSDLELSCYDGNSGFKDDLMASTRIDLENRLFSQTWKEKWGPVDKPTEYRTLWSPSSRSPQGKMEMWIEILTPEEARDNPAFPLAPPVPEDFELRVIVWNTKDVPMTMRGVTKNSIDTFVRGVAEWKCEKAKQDTDTHRFSKDGQGWFNWRMKWQVTIPERIPRLRMQVYDSEVVTPNDVQGEAILNLKGFFKKAYKTKKTQDIERQWITFRHPNYTEDRGKLELTVQIMTKAEAERLPAGYGRGEPNENPHLDTPPRPTSLLGWGGKFAKKFLKSLGKKALIAAVISAIGFILFMALYFSIVK